MEFMIHSSELMPGASPYAKIDNDIENIYKQIELMFKYFKKKKVEGVSLSDFALSKKYS